MLLSAEIGPIAPMAVPKVLGIFGPAGEATDLTRLDPRPMPEVCPGLLVDELLETKTLFNAFSQLTYFLIIYGLNIEVRLFASLLVLDFTEAGSKLSTWIWWAL